MPCVFIRLIVAPFATLCCTFVTRVPRGVIVVVVLRYFVLKVIYPTLHLTLPDDDDMPPVRFQSGVLLFVTGHIPFELGHPELNVGLRRACRLAPLVPMPEAAVHEDDRMPLRKHDVGMAGQFGGLKAVAESQGVKVAAHKHLRLRVLRPNPAHDFAPLLWRYGVHQEMRRQGLYAIVVLPSPAKEVPADECRDMNMGRDKRPVVKPCAL